MSARYKGEALRGDGTVPRVSAIPLEFSDAPENVVYIPTCHGSLQNADAAIDHLFGLLTSFKINLNDFRGLRGGGPRRRTRPVALAVDDVYFTDEPIVVRARPEGADAQLRASLWRAGDAQPLAETALSAVDVWHLGELIGPGPGAYRVKVSGNDVSEVEDAIAVVARSDMVG